MPRVALIDYGAGNLASVMKAIRAAGGDVYVPSATRGVDAADGIVVPGVGNFAATSALADEWRTAIRNRIAAGTPLLGICLGMQWLFEGSTEAPDVPGLGVLAGTCAQLQTGGGGSATGLGGPPGSSLADREGREARVKVPHVGWNSIDVIKPSRILTGATRGAQAYFTHSYAVPVTGDTSATTAHGVTFASAVERGNIFGVQFHPEKSGDTGLSILAAFLRLCEEA